MSEQGEQRIVVEIFSHEEADRLRAEMKQLDELHRADIQRLEKRVSGLHQTLYECLEALRNLRSKR